MGSREAINFRPPKAARATAAQREEVAESEDPRGALVSLVKSLVLIGAVAGRDFTRARGASVCS